MKDRNSWAGPTSGTLDPEPRQGGRQIETLLMVVAIALAIVAVGLAYVAYSLRNRAERLGRELADAHEQVTRLQKLGSLGEMASSFAHSFNDVLTPIIGRSQLLAQRVTDPQAREWLQTI